MHSPTHALRERAWIALSAALFCAACGDSGTAVARSGPPRNVLLISIDTLRADHCGFMGYGKPTTPFLDSLAARGAVFEQHMVNSNNTLVSHASILTGLLPYTHKTHMNGVALRHGFDTLAESFKDAGFTTASFTSHPAWLARGFGLDQGFDQVESGWILAPELFAKFFDWYDQAEPQRLFAFLHFYDVHSDYRSAESTLPYQSTPELIAQFAGPAPADFTGCLAGYTDRCASEYLADVSLGVEPMPKEHAQYVKGLYDAGLRKFDDDLRAAFAELERRDLLDDTLVVITSDHGEAFLEHDNLLHNTVHEEIMHVPLLVLLPRGRDPAAARIDAVTRSIDIAPTVAELAGLAPIGQGESLVPCLNAGKPPRKLDVFFNEAILRSRDKRSAFKYAHLGEQKLFYDLDADPDENRNLWNDPAFHERNAVRIKRIEARLADMRRAASAVSDSVPPDADTPVVDPAFEKRLRELGY